MLWRLRHRNLVGLSGVAISNGEGYLLMVRALPAAFFTTKGVGMSSRLGQPVRNSTRSRR